MPQLKSKLSDPWAALDAEMRGPMNRLPPGEGWRTKRDLMASWNCGHSKAEKRLIELRESGRVEMFDGIREGVRCVWYRPKKDPA